MNANAAKCPPKNVLSDFGLGILDDRAAETLSEHLETCADCRAQVAKVAGDSFIKRMRQAVGASPEASPAQSPPEPAQTVIFGAESVSNAASSAEIPTQTPASGKRELAGAASAGASASLTLPPALAESPDFEVIKTLGGGGMGVVYLARNRMMDRLEVLKVVNKAFLDRPGALERFQQEIRSAAKLLHPNIVAAHSVPRLGDLLVFAMEYVDGQDLSQVVKRRGPLPVTNATYYAYQVALGLQHAHTKGMVHRDIKPSNLMFAIEDKKHVVKILDFGLAKATSEKAADAGLTKTGQMLGTPDYIAPEQTLDAQKADIRADIYSLGCTLYFLLSGHPPFQGNSLYEILQAHHQTEARPLNLVRADVPAELAAIVSKMMAKDPANRYQTPADVAKALGPFFKAAAQTVPKAELPPPASPSMLPSASVVAAPVPVAAQPQSATADFVAPLGSLAGIEATAGGPRTKTKPSRRRLFPLVAVGLLVVGLIGAAAMIFKVKTPEGVVVLKVNVPNADVLVDGNRVTVTWDDGGKQAQIHVPPGSRKIELQKDGFKAFGETVSIADGGQELLAATLQPLTGPAIAPPASSTTSAPPLAVAPFDTKQARAHQEAWAKYLGVPVEKSSSIGMKLVLIPPCEFTMGSTPEQFVAARKMAEESKIKSDDFMLKRLEWESPQHRVTLTRPYWLGLTEVTIGQFKKFVDATKYVTDAERLGFGNSGGAKLNDKIAPEQRRMTWRAPGYDVTDDSPVAQVSGNDDMEFCNWLSDQDGLKCCYRRDAKNEWAQVSSGNGYRLPTEAEWEYACRAGTTTQFSFGDDPAMLDQYAWCSKNSTGRAQVVGLKLANPFGLYDMHGNLSEQCHDWHGPDYYTKSAITNPAGPVSGSFRMSRCGCFSSVPVYCRSTYRGSNPPVYRSAVHGFRVVLASSSSPTVSGNPDVAASSASGTPTTAQPNPDDSRSPHELLHAYRQRIKAAWPGREDRLRIDEQNHLKLDLSNCQEVHDLTPLAGMRLHSLNLRHCKDVSYIAPLRGMPLVYLNLGGCRDITSLDPVKGMPLEELWFDNVSNFSPLVGLPLRKLNISGSSVTDLTPLAGLQLTSVNFHDCGRLADLSPLKGMPLTEVWLQGCGVRDLTPLKGMKLTGLSASYTQAADLAALAGMPLNHLLLDNFPNQSQVQDLGPIRGLPLNHCRLGNCEQIKDLTPLAGMPLTDLALPPNTSNEDLHLFKDAAITSLELVNCVRVTDLAQTAKMPLERLAVNGCERLSDLSPLTGRKLQFLWIYRTAITDIGPLRGMPLNEIGLMPANISSGIEVLRGMPSLRFIEIGENDPTARFAAREFWKRYDAGEFTSKQPAAVTAAVAPYKWPPGTPAPAIAPFDTKQARGHQEAWAKHLGVPIEQTNSIGMKLVLIPPGEFMMGSTPEQSALGDKMAEDAKLKRDEFAWARLKEEGPLHRVAITKPFLLGMTEATIGQFKEFVERTNYVTEAEQFGFGNSAATTSNGNTTPEQKKMTWRTPGYGVTGDSPVTQVTWNDAVQFCNWLTEQEKLKPCYRQDAKEGWILLSSGSGYRLPTEGEWEYACRAGTTKQFSFGDDPATLDLYGWFNKNSGGSARAVGLKVANAFALFGMHGNVWEWCHDSYAADYYSGSPPADPAGASTGSVRITRGGDWSHAPLYCRSAYRSSTPQLYRHEDRGFRVLRVAATASVTIPPAAAAGPVANTADQTTSKPDPIGAKLAKAKETYENKVRSLRDGVLKNFDRKEATARSNGDKKLVDQIKEERAAFEERGRVPALVPTGDYRRQLDAARAQLEAAYTTAIKAYTKAGLDERSTAAETELTKFQHESRP